MSKLQNPTSYIYNQFSQTHFSSQSEAWQTFNPIAVFRFPNTAKDGEGKEIQYRRTQLPGAAGKRLYSSETFSGETPESILPGQDPVQLGRYQYFYFNQRGDVTSLLKHNSQSLHSYLYDEYGMLYDNNQKPKNASNFTDPHNHYAFSAKEFDEESELSYFGARSYDPWSGTWMTQDTYRGELTNPASLHRYTFVENNPINNVDKDGYYLEQLASYGAKIYAASALKKPVELFTIDQSTIQQTPSGTSRINVSGRISLDFSGEGRPTLTGPIQVTQQTISGESAKAYLNRATGEIAFSAQKPKCKERDEKKCYWVAVEEKAAEITDTKPQGLPEHVVAAGKGLTKPIIGTVKTVVLDPIDFLKNTAGVLETGGKLFIDNAGNIIFHPFESTKQFVADVDELTKVIREDPERVKQELLYETVGGQLLLQKIESCKKSSVATTECIFEIPGVIIETVAISKGVGYISREIKVIKKARDLADLSKAGGLKKLDEFTEVGGKLEMIQTSVSTKFSTNPQVPDFLRGRLIKDVIEDLKTGKLSPEKLPINYVEIDGRNIILNNRTYSAVKGSGFKPVFQRATDPNAIKFGRSLLERSEGAIFDYD